MTTTLADALPAEIERVQELIPLYKAVPMGFIAASMMQQSIKQAHADTDNGVYREGQAAMSFALASLPSAAASGEASAVQEAEAHAVDWQQRCLDKGFQYARAPDDHWVECTEAQAIDLLRDVLGIDVQLVAGDERRHVICLCPDCVNPAPTPAVEGLTFTDAEIAENPRLTFEPEKWIRREDGKVVRVDRWEWGIRAIVSTLWGNRHEFEIADVVQAVEAIAASPVPMASSAGEPLQFVCNNGCGCCGVKLVDFEYERTETLEGELLSSKTHPRIVSACCGSDVDVWDERAQDVTGAVSIDPPDAPPAASLREQEDAALIDRLGKLLAGVAIALKGDELPLHLHSYHDLPEVAQVIKLELDLYRSLFPNGVPESVIEQAGLPMQAKDGGPNLDNPKIRAQIDAQRLGREKGAT